MPILEFEKEAEDELDALYEADADSAALIDAVIEQLEDSPKLLESLCIEGSHLNRKPSFEVKRFQELWRNKYTIYFLKITPEDGPAIGYRVLYGHHPQKDIYHILAIMAREINYESDHPLIQRICNAYENLGIPRY
ncbi:type II toxin-antitoxin system RelE/ParE family toxin [Pollutimonas sp. M17]|uniref:type II toxin-antitoxin system RelE/ParE family toxin n=1 Tax=Pollutimonas sp. M17 TaxID=2962065 RepID=UPI0021F48FC7|nr:type II toxin-antitoxin system RelE/ParE family toxin [Pollutimonas sp. M17]UYO95008.1 type II toxin-antitoxin system RelE/ParE family toxin [Pollutimonas sp. M17]